MKRITISLDDDLYRIAKAYAQSEDISLSKAVVRLMRRGMGNGAEGRAREDPSPYREVDPRTGFPLLRVGRPVTMEEVQELIDDDDLRILEQLRSPRP